MNAKVIRQFASIAIVLSIVFGLQSSNASEGASRTATSGSTLKIPFTLQTDESNAALLGRQCAVIWFASESKTFKEASVEKDLLAAVALAKALGVPYTEQQFRNAFKKTERKVAEDFNTLFPDVIAKGKGDKIRDIYLFSFECTASRNWVSLVPLFKPPAEQETPRKFVANPLAKAMKVAQAYDAKVASQCEELGIRSLSEPMSTFDATDRFAAEVLAVQKQFLLKFLTVEQAEMVLQPFLMRKH